LETFGPAHRERILQRFSQEVFREKKEKYERLEAPHERPTRPRPQVRTDCSA